MAFLASSPGTPAQVAGPLDVAGLAEAYGKLEYGIDFGQGEATDTVGDVLDVANAAAGIFMGAAVKMTEAINLRNAVLVVSPKTLPPVEIPYMVGFSCTALDKSGKWFRNGSICLHVQSMSVCVAAS